MKTVTARQAKKAEISASLKAQGYKIEAKKIEFVVCPSCEERSGAEDIINGLCGCCRNEKASQPASSERGIAYDAGNGQTNSTRRFEW